MVSTIPLPLPPSLPTLPPPRLGVVLGILVLALAFAAPGFAQAVGDEPPPPSPPPAEPPPAQPPPTAPEPTQPAPPPVVEIEIPVEPAPRRSVTLIVPPLPEQKPATALEPEPAPPSPLPPPPAPTPAVAPQPAAQPEPEPAPAQTARKTRPVQKRKPTSAGSARPRPPVTAQPSGLIPLELPSVRPRRAFAQPASYSSSPSDSSLPTHYLLLVLGALGSVLLGVAQAAPRLAPHWPGIFVPVSRGRETLSVFGLCLLASGLLAWAIVTPSG